MVISIVASASFQNQNFLKVSRSASEIGVPAPPSLPVPALAGPSAAPHPPSVAPPTDRGSSSSPWFRSRSSRIFPHSDSSRKPVARWMFPVANALCGFSLSPEWRLNPSSQPPFPPLQAHPYARPKLKRTSLRRNVPPPWVFVPVLLLARGMIQDEANPPCLFLYITVNI